MTTHKESPIARELHAEIETYYQHGTWYNRRHDCDQPFASGESREQLIAIGVEVARWNSLRHVVRDTMARSPRSTPTSRAPTLTGRRSAGNTLSNDRTLRRPHAGTGGVTSP